MGELRSYSSQEALPGQRLDKNPRVARRRLFRVDILPHSNDSNAGGRHHAYTAEAPVAVPLGLFDFRTETEPGKPLKAENKKDDALHDFPRRFSGRNLGSFLSIFGERIGIEGT